MLYGRVKERAALDALLTRVRAGQGGGVVLRGEPGIGKTALLGYAAERATGFRVLRTTGVEPESDLGYAALHRLLLPVLDRVDRLPEPQARGLGVVFGQATGPVPDRFLVALATLSLLSEAAGDRPVLCLVDDAHWADWPTLSTLAFVARRLDAEPVALALAARADEGRPLDAAGLVDLPLAGLDRDAAGALLAAGDQLSEADRAELLRATGGNPLAIRELPASALRAAGSGEPLPLAAADSSGPSSSGRSSAMPPRSACSCWSPRAVPGGWTRYGAPRRSFREVPNRTRPASLPISSSRMVRRWPSGTR